MDGTFIRSALVAAVIVSGAVVPACSKDQQDGGPRAVAPASADVTFPGMQLRPGGNPDAYTLIGRIRNTTEGGTITEVKLQVWLIDVLATDAATTVGSAEVVLTKRVPPGGSASFEETVTFSGLPPVRGSREWNYSVAGVRRER